MLSPIKTLPVLSLNSDQSLQVCAFFSTLNAPKCPKSYHPEDNRSEDTASTPSLS